MRALLKILPFLTIVLLADPALARTGAQIKADFDAGIAAYDAGDYQKAFRLWWDLQFEDVAAMRNAAKMLREGQGVAKDPKLAEELYERAANAGLPTAQADLAEMLMKGEAGPPDLGAALPLLQAAAAAHHPVAQYELGQLYETGAPPYVPKNLDVARQLYAAAAGRGMKEAAARLETLPPLTPAAEAAKADAATTAPPPAPQP